MKITIEATNIDCDKVKRVIDKCGVVVHSIYGVSVSMKIIEEVNTPQDR